MMMEGGDENSQSPMDETSASKRPKMDSWESDRLLNFATAADEFELSLKRQKIPRDPMSHRIIEKRRRDRMNNCLADLSRLIPATYHKQGQGRIEKTEIIEMAIKHIDMLQQRGDELEKKLANQEKGLPQVPPATPPPPAPLPLPLPLTPPESSSQKFYMGFREAQDEVMRFLVEVESVNTSDPFCKRIMSHLENASQKFLKEQKTDLPHLESECVSGGSQAPMFQRSSSYYGSPMSNPVIDEGLSGSDSRRGSMPLFSYSSHMSGITSSNLGSSGYVSDTSNMEKASPTGSTSSRDNVYKFKHNITKRFSQEGHHHHHHHHHHRRYDHHRNQHHHNQPSDTSSNTSSRDLEDDQGQIRWKPKHKRSSPYTDDTGTDNNASQNSAVEEWSNSVCNNSIDTNHNTINSSVNSSSINRGHNCVSASLPKMESNVRTSGSCSGVGGGGGDVTTGSATASASLSTTTPTSGGSSVALPGFILHPTGTHYMPISVHNTNMAELFESAGESVSLPVFHPISIPVHFRRPVISMPDITICTHGDSQQRQQQQKKEEDKQQLLQQQLQLQQQQRVINGVNKIE